jgi:YegS/Rv2252/BmrU family lipid kinase
MTDLLVIANGKCQKGFSSRRWSKAVTRLREIFGNGVEIQYTSQRGDGVRLAREALLAGAGWLAAAGGDGTIHEVVNGYFDAGRNIQPKSSLSFLPCGMGNDWIRTLGLPADLHEAIELLKRTKVHHVDIGCARFQSLSEKTEEKVFINIAEAGMGAKVVESMDHGVRLLRTPLSYMLHAITAIFSYSPRRLQLLLDGRTAIATEPLLSLIAANGRFFGAGMNCAPMALPDDGLLEVITVGNLGKAEVVLNFPSFMKGTYLDMAKVKHYSVKSIDLSSAEKVLLELDGELAGTLPASISILPQAFQLRY